MRTLIVVVASLFLVAGVVGCGTDAATVSPTAAPTSSLVPPLTGQTETDWGRIWDDLPAGFPTYPGATPSGEAADGPASGTLVVDGSEAKVVATWMAGQLTNDGFDAQSSGPTEDGGYVVDAEGDADCAIHVDLKPLGTITTITILYGASCPNP